MPEFNPEQFLDVEALEFYGPNYRELKQQYEGKPAAAEPIPQEAPQATPEAPEELVESDVDVSFSEVYRDITATVGAEEADAVHEFMNNNSSQEEIADYMGYLQEGSQEAIAVFQAAKIAKDAGYEADDVEASSITEDISTELYARYGDDAHSMMELNRQLVSGQITEGQMKMKVLSDPQLLRSCLDAKKRGYLSF